MRKLEYRKLSQDEVEEEIKTLVGWSVREGSIRKEFEFKQYQLGLVFASHVGYVADRLNHHPDIQIGYQKVMVSISTHDVGGISPYDFELASQIDAP